MTKQEWESLCDKCGKCCLEKIKDADTNTIYATKIPCKLLDINKCTCANYGNRKSIVNDCIKLTPYKIAKINWLPKTCAYRLVSENKDLPNWHPLITKNPNSTKLTGNGVNKVAIPYSMFRGNFEDYILDNDPACPPVRDIKK